MLVEAARAASCRLLYYLRALHVQALVMRYDSIGTLEVSLKRISVGPVEI